MCKKSRTLDGDRQEDGWGISYIDKSNRWKIEKSLSPIWKDEKLFDKFSKSKIFCIHARSSSFPNQRGIIEYNQPYIKGRYSFVFNGLLKGVSLKQKVAGKIGAQKIWYLLQKFIKKNSEIYSLEKIKNLLTESTERVDALNIGLATFDNIYALCLYSVAPQYYYLHYYENNNMKFICSEALNGYKSKILDSGEIIRL